MCAINSRMSLTVSFSYYSVGMDFPFVSLLIYGISFGMSIGAFRNNVELKFEIAFLEVKARKCP